jgi:GDP-4-dehydro-6-deoxy-D-mannose reductase
MKMKNEILVTGASGFLGGHLVPALEARGYGVRSHSSRQGDIVHCALPIEGASHVFHLAARTFVPDSWTNPQAFYQVNLLGTLNVLEHCRRQGTPLTLISSYVYGHPRRLPIAEDHPLEALNPYAQSKILAEDLARFYEMHFGLRVVIVRPFNLYGPGQNPPFLIPVIVEQALDPAASVIRLKDLRPRRDYLYINDAIEFLVSTMGKEVKGIYNLGSGESVSVAEVAALIRHAAGTDKPIVSDEQPRLQEIMDLRADISRAAQLRWKPTTALADGIAKVVAAQRARL